MNITEKYKKAGTALGVAASSGLVALTSSITAFADVDVDGAVGKLKNGSADGGTFKDINNGRFGLVYTCRNNRYYRHYAVSCYNWYHYCGNKEFY